MVASLLFVGCSGSVGTVAPQPTASPAPPIVIARGSLAVAMIALEGGTRESRIRVFPPHSDQFIRERVTNGSQFQPNSVAFDRRGHLYVGYNDTSSGGRYEVDDIDIQRWTLTRTIRVPRWTHSSVATDDHDNVYVNSKAFVGGDIDIFRSNTETKPYIQIKDHHSPLTMLVGRDALWVGYEGAFSDALARYRLRSSSRTWFQTIGRNVPLALTVNKEGSLIAALVRLKSGRALDVIDVASGKLARTLVTGNLSAMTTDQSGHIYVSQTSGGPGTSAKVYTCDFLACTNSFETNSSRVVALAVSPLDGMLYVANSGKSRVDVYNPRTAKLEMTIWLTQFELKALAIEP